MGLGGLVAAPLLLQTRPLLCVGRRVESWACIQQPIKKYTTIDQLEFKGGLRQIMVWIGKMLTMETLIGKGLRNSCGCETSNVCGKSLQENQHRQLDHLQCVLRY